jgi:hypothetical protein
MDMIKATVDLLLNNNILTSEYSVARLENVIDYCEANSVALGDKFDLLAGECVAEINARKRSDK